MRNQPFYQIDKSVYVCARFEILIRQVQVVVRIRNEQVVPHKNIGSSVCQFFHIYVEPDKQIGIDVFAVFYGNAGVQSLSAKIGSKHCHQNVQCGGFFCRRVVVNYGRVRFKKLLFGQIAIVAYVEEGFGDAFGTGNRQTHCGRFVFAIGREGLYHKVTVHCDDEFCFEKFTKRARTGVVAHFVQQKEGRGVDVQNVAESVKAVCDAYQICVRDSQVVQNVAGQTRGNVTYFAEIAEFCVAVHAVFPICGFQRRYFRRISGKIFVPVDVQLFAEFNHAVAYRLLEHAVAHDGAFRRNALRNSAGLTCSCGS